MYAKVKNIPAQMKFVIINFIELGPNMQIVLIYYNLLILRIRMRFVIRTTFKHLQVTCLNAVDRIHVQAIIMYNYIYIYSADFICVCVYVYIYVYIYIYIYTHTHTHTHK